MEAGSHACSYCGTGKYSAAAGAATASTCLKCPLNTYSELTGANRSSLCLACPYQQTTSAGSSALDACKCAKGFYGPDGQDCRSCQRGR